MRIRVISEIYALPSLSWEIIERLCPSYFSISVIRRPDQSNLKKQGFIVSEDLIYSACSSWQRALQQAGRHGMGAAAESLQLNLQVRGRKSCVGLM